MRRFSTWQALVMSPLFMGELYRDLARNWRGIGLRLLLLVLLVTWIVTGISWNRACKDFAANDVPKVIEGFPPITITDGVVSSPVEQPYYWKDKSGKAFAVIDTTGEINSLDDTTAIVLLTQTKLHYRDSNNPGQVKIQDLSQIKSFSMDRAKVQAWVNTAAKWGAWIVVPICFIFSFIYRLIQGLIYGAIGLIWNSAFNARLDYAALLRLAFVSVTPSILLSTVLPFVHFDVPAFSLICFGITMIYLLIAVKANGQTAQPMYGFHVQPGMQPPMQPSMPQGYPQQQQQWYPPTGQQPVYPQQQQQYPQQPAPLYPPQQQSPGAPPPPPPQYPPRA